METLVERLERAFPETASAIRHVKASWRRLDQARRLQRALNHFSQWQTEVNTHVPAGAVRLSLRQIRDGWNYFVFLYGVEAETVAGRLPTSMAAVAEIERLSDWKPIATAPRDGTRILAWNAMVGVYNTAFTTRWTGEPGEYRAGAYQGFPCGFWSSGVDDYPFGKWDCRPTHWMPIPPAPDLKSPNHTTSKGET